MKTKLPKLKKVRVTREAQILELLAQLDRNKQQVDKLYAAREEIEIQLRRLMTEGEQFPYDETRYATLMDNFKEKNVCYGHGPVRRFEIKFCKRK